MDIIFNKKLFGRRIKDIRNLKNDSQETVSEVIGITKQTLSGIETGYRAPSIEVATALSHYFKVSLDYLVGSTDNPKGGLN